MFTLGAEDFMAWQERGREVKLRPCVEVCKTVHHDTFTEVQTEWLPIDVCFDVGELDVAVAMAEAEAARREDTTGRHEVVAIVGNVTVETPAYVSRYVGWQRACAAPWRQWAHACREGVSM